MEDIKTEDLVSVDSHGDHHIVELGEKVSSASHPGEGILLANPRLTVKDDDLGKFRYTYKIPKSMEILTPEVHERVDWVVPSWVALYGSPFSDGMRLQIPRLVRDVLNHYEIAPTQLMPNVWRLLMLMECLNMQHDVTCELGQVLYSYYLKKHDTDKG